MISRFATILLVIPALQLLTAIAPAALPRDTPDYPADPRPIIAEFFQHIRAGEAEAAWKCWNAEVSPNKDQQSEETQVRNTIAQWIAQYRLEQALAEKLPKLYENAKTNHALTPTPEQIAKATFTTFRRLAIVRWSDDEDAALPLELDTHAKPPKWLVSLRHYRETTRASVGDSFRATDLMARALDDVTKDVLSGKVTTGAELQTSQLDHVSARLEKMPKSEE